MREAPKDTPTDAEVIQSWIKYREADFRVCLPGIVESFDAATCMASVSPCLKRRYDSETIVDLPVINSVPVIMPRAGAALISLPLKKGDEVTLVFSDRSLDVWKTRGGKVDPADVRMHHIADAFAIPGGTSKANPPPADSISDTDIVISNEQGRIALKPDGKFSVTNPTAELVAQLLLVIDKVMASQVATSIGLQPLIPDPEYVTERAKLDSFVEA